MLPKNYVMLDEKHAEQMIRLIEALEENDDVQNVYTNFDAPDEVMAKTWEVTCILPYGQPSREDSSQDS